MSKDKKIMYIPPPYSDKLSLGKEESEALLSPFYRSKLVIIEDPETSVFSLQEMPNWWWWMWTWLLLDWKWRKL